jgi:hypothetical protein
MPRHRLDKGQAAAPEKPGSSRIPPIHQQLNPRQQREVLRYAQNFALEPAVVVRQLQACVVPAIETEIDSLVARSDAYEQARAEHERALRVRFLGFGAVDRPSDRTPLEASATPSDDGPTSERHDVLAHSRSST